MLERIYQNQFVRDAQKLKSRGKDLTKMEVIIILLLNQKALPQKNRNHKLKGNFQTCWECHIEPDWLLIYKKTSSAIILMRTGMARVMED